ncbi:MAG: hypothetical protein IKH25_02400, partial [Muribaculaceae bacterium]|nr:hypothetical protein [Muribaculaceae bacterium]
MNGMMGGDRFINSRAGDVVLGEDFGLWSIPLNSGHSGCVFFDRCVVFSVPQEAASANDSKDNRCGCGIA